MAGTIKITIRGAAEAAEKVAAAIRTGAVQALEMAGLRGEQLVKQNIASPYLGKPAAVATGTLVSSIAAQLEPAGGLLGREVVFAQPPADQYAAYVEAGTGPHFPPARALLLWVKRKFNPQSENEAMSIAWAVARAIGRRGTFGHGMFARAFQTLSGELAGIFERNLAQAFEAAGLGRK